MTTEDTKILKLSSGEEVICNVVNNPEQSHISVVYPMKMQSYPKATKNGIEESLSLQRWIHFAEEDTFNMRKNQCHHNDRGFLRIIKVLSVLR